MYFWIACGAFQRSYVRTVDVGHPSSVRRPFNAHFPHSNFEVLEWIFMKLWEMIYINNTQVKFCSEVCSPYQFRQNGLTKFSSIHTLPRNV